jgi:transketolase
MRNAFIEEISQQAQTNPRIALVVGDLGYGVVERFAEEFPERFFNAGVAEQNMMGLCAGLASEGYQVFAYSIANFPTFRCAEQVRNDIAYHQLPVTVVSVGGGLAYGSLGYSHHAVQDYALMRVLPHMLIAAPGDPMEVRACVRYLSQHPQPSYLRLGKAGEPCLHNAPPNVQPGHWTAVGEGSQPHPPQAMLSTGATLALASEWASHPGPWQGSAVYSMPLWGMAHKALQGQQIRRFDHVLTVEDHLTDGGFGTWMLEAVRAEPELLVRLQSKALSPEVCGMVGSQSALNALGGLTL